MDAGAQPRRNDARDVLGSFLGMAGMAGMAAMLFIVLASSLGRPWWVAALPVVMALLWICAVSAGAAFLDWNA